MNLVRGVAILTLVTLSVLSYSFILRATRQGLGFSPDSVLYYSVAQGIAEGKGIVDVRRYDTPAPAVYPPGYPALLALGGILLGGELLAAIRLVQALLFSLSTAVVGWVAWRYSHSAWVLCLGCLFFLGSSDLIPIHAMVWSEGAFIATTLLCLAAVAVYLEGGRARWLVAAALLASFATLARYPGIATIAAGAFALFFQKTSWRRKVQDLTIFAGVSCPLLLSWLVRNQLVTGEVYFKAGGPSTYAFSAENLGRGLTTLQGWLGRPTGSYPALLVLVLLGLWLIDSTQRTEGLGRETRQRPPALRCLVLPICGFLLAYCALMLAATYSYGLHKPLDSRALGPLYGPFVWLVLLGGHQLAARARLAPQRSPSRAAWLRALGYGLAAVAIGALAFVSIREAIRLSEPGRVRGLLQRKTPEIFLAFVGMSPPGVVFTNEDDFLYMATGERCLRLPLAHHFDHPDVRLPEFEDNLQQLREALGQDGIIVYLERSHRGYLPSEEELREFLPVTVVTRTGDGTIYRINQKP